MQNINVRGHAVQKEWNRTDTSDFITFLANAFSKNSNRCSFFSVKAERRGRYGRRVVFNLQLTAMAVADSGGWAGLKRRRRRHMTAISAATLAARTVSALIMHCRHR